jgi:hypothetical protein
MRDILVPVLQVLRTARLRSPCVVVAPVAPLMGARRRQTLQKCTRAKSGTGDLEEWGASVFVLLYQQLRQSLYFRTSQPGTVMTVAPK